MTPLSGLLCYFHRIHLALVPSQFPSIPGHKPYPRPHQVGVPFGAQSSDCITTCQRAYQLSPVLGIKWTPTRAHLLFCQPIVNSHVALVQSLGHKLHIQPIRQLTSTSEGGRGLESKLHEKVLARPASLLRRCHKVGFSCRSDCLRYVYHMSHSRSGSLSHHAHVLVNQHGIREGNKIAICFSARTISSIADLITW